MVTRRVTASALIFVALTLAAADQNLARKMADELRGCTRAISNPIVQSFVDSLSQRLAAQLPKRNSSFTLSIIEDDLSPAVHEPIVLLGGYIFVPAALFVAAQDEAEFAGMLTQAMGQSNAIDEDLSRLGSRSYMTALQGFICAFPRAVPANYLGERRAIERRADITAVSVMSRAGFDPNALVSYIERVQVTLKLPAPPWSTLPPVKKRIAGMRAEIAKLPPSAYPIRNSSEFVEATEQVRRLLAALIPPSGAPSLKRK